MIKVLTFTGVTEFSTQPPQEILTLALSFHRKASFMRGTFMNEPISLVLTEVLETSQTLCTHNQKQS